MCACALSLVVHYLTPPGFGSLDLFIINHITYSLLEKCGYEKIIAILLNNPTIENYDP